MSYEQKTGSVYGKLFTDYDEKLFEESVSLFEMRHKRWGQSLEWFKGKECLDAGCGGGRFVVALARLGAKRVVGIDISADAIKAAKNRIQTRGLENAEAQVASVLDIPFPDNSFDYVVSSGVIHHTPDPKKAFQELNRVLRPGGKLFLSVYGKGGLKWITNDLFRYTICKLIPFKTMNRLWEILGVPPNKRYNMLDNMYVPYIFRFTEKEIRGWLETAGYTNIERLKFERYDYSTLKSRLIHGEGWLQFYAEKK